jgi:hypothetical protein
LDKNHITSQNMGDPIFTMLFEFLSTFSLCSSDTSGSLIL